MHLLRTGKKMLFRLYVDTVYLLLFFSILWVHLSYRGGGRLEGNISLQGRVHFRVDLSSVDHCFSDRERKCSALHSLNVFSDFGKYFLLFFFKMLYPLFSIFLFLSRMLLLAVSFFILGPYVGEILETEGVCSPYWHLYCLSRTGYWKMLTQNLSPSFINALKILTKFKNQESLVEPESVRLWNAPWVLRKKWAHL